MTDREPQAPAFRVRPYRRVPKGAPVFRPTRFGRIALDTVFWLSLAYLLIECVNLGFFAIKNGTNVTTEPFDGTFQLYDPLRRIDLGQVPGVDFQFFHGLGVPYLHWPIFALLGGGLFGAETTKWATSPLLFLISIAIFFWAYFRSVKKTVIATSFVFGISAGWMVDDIFPQLSLLGVRMAFPTLVAAAMLWATPRTLRVWRYRIPWNIVAAAILLGFAFVCGTEQGAAAMVAFAMVRGWHYLRVKESWLHRAVPWAMEVVAGIVTALLLETIITRGNPLPALRYALIDIPDDQSWYFAGPPNPYATWAAMAHFLATPYPFIAMGAIAVALAIRSRHYPASYGTIAYFVIYGAVAFFVSITGYFYSDVYQLVPFEHGLALFGAALGVDWAFRPHPKVADRVVATVLIAAGVAFLIPQGFWTTVGTVNLKPHQLISKAATALHSDDRYVLSTAWKKDVDTILAKVPQGATIWSTYTSVDDSLRGDLNPSSDGVDYIIHALGDDRRARYSADFAEDKPQYVITMTPHSFNWEERLWIENWPFYSQVFANYTLIATSSMHMLWEYDPNPSALTAPSYPLDEHNGGQWFLPANDTKQMTTYQVTVEYQATTPLPIPYLDKTARYFIDVHASGCTRLPVSVPEGTGTWTFPVVVAAGDRKASILGRGDGLIPANVKIVSASYQVMPTTSSMRTEFLSNSTWSTDPKSCK